MNSKSQIKGVLLLLLTSLIWGISFVSQSVGMESVDAFTFMGIRTLMGATVLLPFIIVRDNITKKNMTKEELTERKANDKKTIKYGIIIGIFLCIATNLQQFAFYYSTAGKIAFITAMYMFFVPLVGLFFKKKVPLSTWLCIAAGVWGLFLLCVNPSEFGKFNKGDILALICALFFCFQILLIERFAPSCDGVKLSCVQFYTSGIITAILMIIFEKPEWKAIKSAAIPLLYSGIMSCGIAYTLQVVGQKYCEATIASLAMCMESVFAVLASAILLHEKLSGREITGCAIMFAAIVTTQLVDIYKSRKQNKL
ncbi:MAG: DMT family transporter [Treponema sp.]|nr:DMT family transporter [Spirochaetia bacterium]MDY2839466.1 DMT family transporter [Treponema sp.]